jgi:hypothetical protein
MVKKQIERIDLKIDGDLKSDSIWAAGRNGLKLGPFIKQLLVQAVRKERREHQREIELENQTS